MTPRSAARLAKAWLQLGQLQFDYLSSHGLKPGMRMLEVGCGNLRAGRLFIDYLDAGNYYGTDISPDILLAAQRTIGEYGLQRKLPYLTLVDDLRLQFLPDGHFDVVHAHSVFSHSPLSVIEECLAHVGRIMAPGGFFDFTFDRTDGTEHQVLREDFYYRTETLIALAERYGLSAEYMADWEADRARAVEDSGDQASLTGQSTLANAGTSKPKMPVTRRGMAVGHTFLRVRGPHL